MKATKEEILEATGEAINSAQIEAKSAIDTLSLKMMKIASICTLALAELEGKMRPSEESDPIAQLAEITMSGGSSEDRKGGKNG